MGQHSFPPPAHQIIIACVQTLWMQYDHSVVGLGRLYGTILGIIGEKICGQNNGGIMGETRVQNVRSVLAHA